MNKDQRRFYNAVLASAVFLILIWSVQLLIEFGGLDNWRKAGNHPREIDKWWGIFTMPFLHAKGLFESYREVGKTSHIFNNSISFAVLNTILFYFYHKVAFRTWSIIALFSGLFVWVIGVEGSNHIGASGVVYGLAFFVLFAGILKRRNLILLRMSLLVAFLYGSIVWGIFPIQDGVSWEGHMGGAIAGVFCAYFFRSELPEGRKYQWEIEEELEKLNEGKPSKQRPNGKTAIVQIYKQFRYKGIDRGF